MFLKDAKDKASFIIRRSCIYTPRVFIFKFYFTITTSDVDTGVLLLFQMNKPGEIINL